MRILRGENGVEHDRNITAGGILHSNRNGNSAGCQTVFLVFHTSGTYSDIGKQIGQIPVIVRIEHFVRRRQAGIGQNAGMEPTNCDHTLQHIRFLLRIRLMKQPFITGAGGPGLVGIHPGNQNQLLSYGLLKPCQPLAVIKNRILPVSRAGAYNQHHFAAASGKHIGNLCVPRFFYAGKCFGQGILFFDFLGDRQLSPELHIFHTVFFFLFCYFSSSFCEKQITENSPDYRIWKNPGPSPFAEFVCRGHSGIAYIDPPAGEALF